MADVADGVLFALVLCCGGLLLLVGFLAASAAIHFGMGWVAARVAARLEARRDRRDRG